MINNFNEDCEGPMIQLDGCDDCIIGVTMTEEGEAIVYNWDCMIEQNMSHGMDWEEAVEYFDYNQSCLATTGATSPIWVEMWQRPGQYYEHQVKALIELFYRHVGSKDGEWILEQQGFHHELMATLQPKTQKLEGMEYAQALDAFEAELCPLPPTSA